MTRKQRLKIHLNAVRFSMQERAFDLLNITLPVFVITGIIGGCVKFWCWAWGLGL